MNSKKDTKEIKYKKEIIGRNVAIYLNLASRSPAIELHAALISDLLSRGNKVTAYICDNSFSSPMDNPFNRSSIERLKMFRARDAVKNLDVKFKIINLKNIKKDVPQKIEPTLELGVMSSFASLLKAQSKDELSEKWQRAYYNMLESAKKLYNYFIEEIQKEKYDFVFMYNGRFGDVRPVLEATRDSNIGFGLNELKRVTLEVVCINELVHSIEGNTRRAMNFYEKDKEAAEINAKIFFAKRLTKKDKKEPIYTKKQKKGDLPEAVINKTKKIISIYPTTDDEYKFIGKEWDGYVPEDQVVEIEEIITNLPTEEYIIVVKMHPNQEYTAENTINRYVSLAKKYPNVVVEKPLSIKDTYALMMKSDAVVVFASFVGIEASYQKKPVILIGDTTWGKMDMAHKVHSGKEAANLIKNNVQPKPILGAIIWANYYDGYKDYLPGLKVDDKGNYFVNGKRVGQSRLRRILQLPAKIEIMTNLPGFKVGTTFFVKIIDVTINIIKGKWNT